MEAKHYTLVTHPLNFHADDTFACAILALVIEKAGGTWDVTRTRDVETIAAGDIVFDVGMIDDAATLRFDHHQKGGAGTHADGIPYASCGLVWKEFGIELCGNQSVAERIEKELIEPIDAEDNGMSLVTPLKEVVPFTIQDVLYLQRATWKEDLSQHDIGFLQQVEFAKKMLVRMIKVKNDLYSGEGLAELDYGKAVDKRLIITEDNYPAMEFLESKPEPLYLVRKNTDGSGWRVIAVRKFPHSFENRKDLPKEWAGLREEELARVSGVPDATFCHNGLWLAVAKSKEGALALAEMAISG
jgi:uncharacterized UPF0160 family protein